MVFAYEHHKCQKHCLGENQNFVFKSCGSNQPAIWDPETEKGKKKKIREKKTFRTLVELLSEVQSWGAELSRGEESAGYLKHGWRMPLPCRTCNPKLGPTHIPPSDLPFQYYPFPGPRNNSPKWFYSRGLCTHPASSGQLLVSLLDSMLLPVAMCPFPLATPGSPAVLSLPQLKCSYEPSKDKSLCKV